MRVSPDGARYLAIAQGVRTARPFHFRWMIPHLCGTEERAWLLTRAAALIGLIPAAFWYAGGGIRGVCVAAMPLALAGVWSFNWKFPILVDAPAMVVALACAACVQQRLWGAAVLLAFAAATMKETAPIFAALWSWSWIPLVGLVAVVLRAAQRPGPDTFTEGPAYEALVHPLRTAWASHRSMLTEPAVWLLPWGVLLVGLARPGWQVAATCAAAYGQCVVATDRVRLYQWAWPVLAVATFDAIPRAWWLLAVLVHFAHPWRTDGV